MRWWGYNFRIGCAVLASWVGCFGAHAQDGPRVDFELFTDFRLGVASGEQSWLADRLGKGRFGGSVDGRTRADFDIAEIALLANIEFDWEWSAFVHAKHDNESQDGPIDLVEAYVEYNPTPTSSTRYKARAGLFFPHISRENVGVAWSSPYTITPSAINSWIGEEIRALGIEATASFRGEVSKLDVTGGLFGFNDAAGTLLAFRGWSFGDIKGSAFSRLDFVQLPQIGPNGTLINQPFWVEPVAEIDDRVGFYGSVDYTYARNWKVGAFYYDNRGNPAVIRQQQYGWDTKFWNFYIEGDAPLGLHMIAQYMTGSTAMGRVTPTGARYTDIDYNAGFVLASKKFGSDQRLSARFDWFDTKDFSFVQIDNNNEAGAAGTIAYSVDVAPKSTLMLEYLYIDSKRVARRDIGVAPDQTQSIFQIAYRQRF